MKIPAITVPTPGSARRHAGQAALALLAILMAACGPLQGPEADRAARAGAERSAAALASAGRHGEAAQAYRDLALTARSVPEQQRLLTLVTREEQQAGDLEAARRTLASVPRPIAETNALLWAQVAGSVLLAVGEPDRALAEILLARQAPDARSWAELLRLRAEALFALGRPTDAVAALVERETLLTDASEVAENRRAILAGVRETSANITSRMASEAADPIVAGWLALGAALGAPQPALAVNDWRARYPRHPANETLAAEAQLAVPVITAAPRRLALLLPLSGRQQALGAAVRDGFLAARFENPGGGPRPDVGVYDVEALGAITAYRQAVADGADWIVGPLLKDAVLEVAAESRAIPVLALNTLAEGQSGGPGFYQFALLPEDEARQVATGALAAGRERAIALIPASEWGQRVLSSFMAEFEPGGGQLLGYRPYDPLESDFSGMIEDLLLIAESEARKNRLAADLGVTLGFSPRRRQDVDLILLAAGGRAGRLLRPQLRFYGAGAVATYATSAVYDGGTASTDLDGVIFPDAPWIANTRPEIESVKATLDLYWPRESTQLARFYAMGYDAWGLVPALATGSLQTGAIYRGVSGALSLDGAGAVHRELDWLEIRRGRPTPVAPPMPSGALELRLEPAPELAPL